MQKTNLQFPLKKTDMCVHTQRHVTGAEGCFLLELLNSLGIFKHFLSSFHSLSDFCGRNNATMLVSSKYDELF